MTEVHHHISNPDSPQIEHRASESRRPFWPRNALLGAGALGILALSLVSGAAAWSASRHSDFSFDTNLAATPIAELADASSVGVTGQVAEIYGNKFVVTDGTARALVETGPAGEGGRLVSPNETVTVQGRFHDGFLHAAAIRHADQRVDELDPPPPPHHGPEEPVEAN
ncbi:hypothetical protein GCM10011390_26330 [Aureimonas endophytica]|uniref:Uncharacterized protein n=1 Tax=Aureimonas endophytica TaxID=2027858 RepID=A0A916ZNG2_9HYPH|nr:hypothetical protein [Aureimonas endophytica]GGE05978.1 hypothetical protein GCM10011390_26330 [Aureimonas endophytica]